MDVATMIAGIDNKKNGFDIFNDVSKGYFGDPYGKLRGRILPILETKKDESDLDYYTYLIEVWQRCDSS